LSVDCCILIFWHFYSSDGGDFHCTSCWLFYGYKYF